MLVDIDLKIENIFQYEPVVILALFEYAQN